MYIDACGVRACVRAYTGRSNEWNNVNYKMFGRIGVTARTPRSTQQYASSAM